MSRWIRFCAGCGLVLLLLGSATAADNVYAPKRLRIGVLVSLTGLWSTLGRNTQAALNSGAARLNAESDRTGEGYRIELLVRDTRLVPEVALKQLEDLDQKGVKVVIGPQSSAELELLKPYADAHNILLVSQSSTASSLAVAGDNVFRFCPGEKLEAQAIVALLSRDGIRVIVPFWRGDLGNDGLHDSVRAAFVARGGAVADGYRYDPATTDFSAGIAAVSSQVARARAGADPSTIAVYLGAFDKVVAIFQAASADSVLNTTAWYGSDGTANSAALLSSPRAAAFAASVGFPNPVFGLDPASETAWRPLATEIHQATGAAPDAFALAAYDSLFVAYRALQQSRGGRDFAALKSAFANAANSYTGATGPTILDAAGDRVFSSFDFWAIRPVDGHPSWVVVGRHVGGTLHWNEKPSLTP